MKDIIFIGDLHSNLAIIKWYIKQYNIKDTYFIQVGDFGAGFLKEKSYDLLNDFIKLHNNYLYVIRGNHDNPNMFTETKHIRSNIVFIKDYEILKILDYNILFIGGAISIDREYRIENELHYWENEKVNFDNNKINIIKKYNNNIDICVTHTAPSFLDPMFLNTNDNKLRNDISRERIELTKIFDILKNKNLMNWYYGHFHDNKSIVIEMVKFTMLGEGKFLQHN